MFKKILLAYNGSREGKTGLLSCAEIASFTKAETHLLAVASMPPSVYVGEGFLPQEILEEEKRRMQDVLDEGIEQLRQRGFQASGHLGVGEPVEEISRRAAQLGVDLIIVGHEKKASWVERWWRGSVGKTLVDTAPCSILIALHRA